jgi:hypothetical protein
MTKPVLFGILNFGYSCLPAGRGICLVIGACHLVLVPKRLTASLKTFPRSL